MYQFKCNDDNFEVESDDKKEIIEMVQIHAKEKHGMNVSDEEVEKGIREE